MRLWGVVLIGILLAPVFSGCMGPSNAEARTPQAPRYRSYYNNVTLPVDGIEMREPSCTPGPPVNCTEFYLIRVFGSENATLVKGPDVLKECLTNSQFRFRVNPDKQLVEYNASKYTAFSPQMQTLLAQEFYGVVFGERNAIQGCPTTYGLFGFQKSPPPSHKTLLGSYGILNLTVYRSGGIAVNQGQITFPLGEKLLVSYGTFRTVGESQYFVQGGFEVVNLGPWPISALQPGEGKGQGS